MKLSLISRGFSSRRENCLYEKNKKNFCRKHNGCYVDVANIWGNGIQCSFANFTFTTIPYAEKWERVTSKVKVDNEQNWYLTLTQKSELDSKEVRALAISNDVDPAMQGLNPYPLKSTTTSSGAIKYQKQVTKNRTYSLYVSGNENVSKPHKIVISGRYTS